MSRHLRQTRRIRCLTDKTRVRRDRRGMIRTIRGVARGRWAREHARMTSTISEATSGDENTIVAGPGRYYRNTRYLMLVLMVGLGLWFAYDGFLNWPQMNLERDRIEADRVSAANSGDQMRARQLYDQEGQLKHHTDWDIGLQKFLAFTLPVAGILLLARALHNSRGELRLEGETLHFPGHPPVKFDQVTGIDRRLWDRKGIAYANYDLGDGTKGRLRLDDFVYDRPSTDRIFERIETVVGGKTEVDAE